LHHGQLSLFVHSQVPLRTNVNPFPFWEQWRIDRRPQIASEASHIIFSVHGDSAQHYGFKVEDVGEPHPATIDYMVASVAG
jgi:hypothetical protein